jgi:hypothetical protein
MTFALTGWMLYAMWAVLILMGINLIVGLNFIVGIFRSFNVGELILSYLHDILHYVFPLFLLANMRSLDPTGWLVLIAYYIGAIGVILKYLTDIKNKL